MKAVTFQGIKDVKVKEVKDPKLDKRDDIIVRVTSTAICGSDLHLIHGMVPNLAEDYIIGHEPMGIVEETGPDVTHVKKGDGSSFHSRWLVVNAIIASTNWRVNAIRLTLTAIPAVS